VLHDDDIEAVYEGLIKSYLGKLEPNKEMQVVAMVGPSHIIIASPAL